MIVPMAVLDTVRALTGSAEIGTPSATFGGNSNLSFFTRIDGRDLVVKAATSPLKRDDLRREARILSRLADLDGSSLPVPVLVAHGEGDGVTLTALDVLIGEHGLVAVQRGSGLAARAAVMGRLLRNVHTAAPVPDPDRASDLSHRAASAVGELAALGLDATITSAMVAALGAPVLRRGVAFVHGDFGFHNTLWTPSEDGRLSGLFDWEFAGWGNPLTDIAWFWWTLRNRSVSGDVWAAFAESYGPEALAALGFEAHRDAMVRAQMVQLLVRTLPGSEARGVWLDRWRALG